LDFGLRIGCIALLYLILNRFFVLVVVLVLSLDTVSSDTFMNFCFAHEDE